MGFINTCFGSMIESMLLKEAHEIVFKKKKGFEKFYTTFRQNTWKELLEKYYVFSFKPDDRTEELCVAIEGYLKKLVSEDTVNKVTHSLKQTGFVSTCDHSGVLNHPFFINNNLVRQEFKETLATLSFTCGGVSLTNSSYPRSIFFHDLSNKLTHLPLISLKGRRRSVYGHSPFSKDVVQKHLQRVETLSLSDSAKNELTHLLATLLNSENLFTQDTYSKQLTILNQILWQEVYADKPVIYIEVEEIVKELLLQTHFTHQTLVQSILFDEKVRNVYIEAFEGVVGAHHTETKSGSHIFWYIDKNKQTRVQLFIQKDTLVSEDGLIQIPLTKEALEVGLKNYSLLPSMAFCYGLLSSYYNLTLGGGFSQIDYLTHITTAWEKVSGEVSSSQKNIFSGEFSLLNIEGLDGNKSPATFVDLLLYGKDQHTDYPTSTTPFQTILSNALSTQTVGGTLNAMMDEFVEIVTGVKPVIEDIEIHNNLKVR